MSRYPLWSCLAFSLLAGCGEGGNFAGHAAFDLAVPARSVDLGIAANDAGGGNGNFGNVGTGGGQDFAAFRRALDNRLIPAPSTLDVIGFFAEHFTSLPAPTCGKSFCLHGMLSVTENLARGGNRTLLQMGMNSPLDPNLQKKPPLDLAVVIDQSGSMAGDDKMVYARTGVKLLIDAMTANDTLTLIAFDNSAVTLFGPGKVADKAGLKAQVDAIQPRGGTNIYEGLEAGYRAALSVGDETQQRRVIFLTDGVATTGNTDPAQIHAMSQGYNEKYIGLTTIGLGGDADLALLRRLAEIGGGNFYFLEKPEAVKEVFTEELAFFVAPIAYDLDLTLDELSPYAVREVLGSGLWKSLPGGGRIRIPSVFLVSRQSAMPSPPDGGADGGRRGGGAAILADLKLVGMPQIIGKHDVARLHLSYRSPGSMKRESQDVTVSYSGAPNAPPPGGFFSAAAIEKNTLILDFFFAFRDAVDQAPSDRAAARRGLTAFQAKIVKRLADWRDEDLLDDFKILQQLIDLLAV